MSCPQCKLWQRPCACTNFEEPKIPELIADEDRLQSALRTAIDLLGVANEPRVFSTGIFVRAKTENGLDDVDLCCLTRESVLAWLNGHCERVPDHGVDFLKRTVLALLGWAR